MSLAQPGVVAERIESRLGTNTYYYQIGADGNRTTEKPLVGVGRFDRHRTDYLARYGLPNLDCYPAIFHAPGTSLIGVWVENAITSGRLGTLLDIDVPPGTEADQSESMDIRFCLFPLGFADPLWTELVPQLSEAQQQSHLTGRQSLRTNVDEKFNLKRHPFGPRSAVWSMADAHDRQPEIFAKQLAWLRDRKAEGADIDELTPESYLPGFQPSLLLARLDRLDELEAERARPVPDRSLKAATSNSIALSGDELKALSALLSRLTSR